MLSYPRRSKVRFGPGATSLSYSSKTTAVADRTSEASPGFLEEKGPSDGTAFLRFGSEVPVAAFPTAIRVRRVACVAFHADHLFEGSAFRGVE